MKSERITRMWEFYRDNCDGFKEPMRRELRNLDGYVSSVEAENAKLRELATALEDCRHTTCDDCVRWDYPNGGCYLDDVMRELGIEVGE